MTKNQRIIYLIEKYEKKYKATASASFTSTKSQEEEKEGKLSMSGQGSASLAKYSPNIGSIREEDIIYEEEEIENQAGGVLD